MHELSIAQNIVDIIQENVKEENLRGVKSVKVQVGELSTVVPDSLEFCFSAIVSETPLTNARLDIQRTPFQVFCQSCQMILPSVGGIALCPKCGKSDTRVVSGTELHVVEIQLEDSKEEVL